MEKKEAKQFMAKLLLLMAPFIFVLLCDLFIFPMDLFNFRVWDSALILNRNAILSGAFYPNIYIDRYEHGDLKPNSEDAVSRRAVWETDQRGFRNNQKGCEEYPYVVVGDSFAVGTGLTQEETLSAQLGRDLGKCVYSFSTLELNDFLATDLKERFKVRTVIYLKSEWWLKNEKEMPGEGHTLSGAPELVRHPELRKFAETSRMISRIGILRHQFSKLSVVHAFQAHGPFWIVARIFDWLRGDQYRYWRTTGTHSQGAMIFRDRKQYEDYSTHDDIEFAAKRLKAFQNEFRKSGINFIVVIVPNKETIYLKDLPKRGDFLQGIYAGLSREHVPYVNLLQPYQEQKDKGLYQFDDSHWNFLGVRVASEKIKEKIVEP